MIRVELMRAGDYLIAKTVSDRWNLETAGIGLLVRDRNHQSVKTGRRKLAKLGLTLSVVRNAPFQLRPSNLEVVALGLVNIQRLIIARAA